MCPAAAGDTDTAECALNMLFGKNPKCSSENATQDPGSGAALPGQGFCSLWKKEESGTELSEALDEGAVAEHTTLAHCECSTKAHTSL